MNSRRDFLFDPDFLALLELVHSRRHDARTLLDGADGVYRPVRIRHRLDVAQRYRLGRLIDQPNAGLAGLGENRRRWQPKSANRSARDQRRDRGTEPEGFRRCLEGDADTPAARHGIRLRRDLANLAFAAYFGVQ